MGHKFALWNIARGQPVIKYGEPIGEAVADIGRGEYVHVHNVVSPPRGGGLQSEPQNIQCRMSNIEGQVSRN